MPITIILVVINGIFDNDDTAADSDMLTFKEKYGKYLY